MGVLRCAYLVGQEYTAIVEEASLLRGHKFAEVVAAEVGKDFKTATVAAVVKVVFACIPSVAANACNDDCLVANSEVADSNLEGYVLHKLEVAAIKNALVATYIAPRLAIN